MRQQRLIMRTILSCIAFLCCPLVCFSAVIHVPADQPTIQMAIDIAANGDVVIVSAGTYFENIDFRGKGIRVQSSDGPGTTIIDGAQKDPVVRFDSGEGRNSVLKGFTLIHGYANPSHMSGIGEGGGVYMAASSPSIIGNIITQNSACDGGGGIYSIAGAPRIQGNTISKNFQMGCSGAEGGGIFTENGAAGTQIIGNKIIGNTWSSGDGGGLMIRAFGNTLIQNNFIANNVATGVSPASHGGGLYLQASSGTVLLLQNVIAANKADQGGGVYLIIGGPVLSLAVNNTIANNISSQEGSAIYVTGSTEVGQLFNNLFVSTTNASAAFCDPNFPLPLLENNDGFTPSGPGFDGSCAGESGRNGNISADPSFIDAQHKNYGLLGGSPAIDDGTNSAPHILTKDFAGNTRIVDGNGDQNAIIDMGAYEFQP